jgi:hypothetical protein
VIKSFKMAQVISYYTTVIFIVDGSMIGPIISRRPLATQTRYHITMALRVGIVFFLVKIR